MSGPLDLAAKRQEKVGYTICRGCTGAYFKVAHITLEADGSAGGYGGIPCCERCGKLQTGHCPEGIAMPCGGCGVSLMLPEDMDHRCDGVSA